MSFIIIKNISVPNVFIEKVKTSAGSAHVQKGIFYFFSMMIITAIKLFQSQFSKLINARLQQHKAAATNESIQHFLPLHMSFSGFPG